MKCANCENQAAYSVTDPGVNPVDYCVKCLPLHLRPRAIDGQLPLRGQVLTPPLPEPVVEIPAEPVVEEVVEKPVKKKSTKKKTS